MNEFPSRATTHVLEEKSDRFLKKYIPVSWVINKPIDYGLDYYIEIAENNLIKGMNFSVQLKSHEQLNEKGDVSIILKRSTVNMYLNRLEPILLVCYIESEQEAFYSWFKDDTVDLTKEYDSYTVKLSKGKKLSILNWDTIIAEVKKIFSRKFLLNVLPEIDFSTFKEEDEKNAAAYYVRGEFEKAEQAYKELLNKDIQVPWLSTLAMCQYSLYRYHEALININRALELSDMLDLWINKASILAEDGIQSRDKAKLLEAKSIFQTAILTYDDAHYCYNYANTLSELGEYGLAEAYYKKALKKNPNYAEAWKNLGEVYFRKHCHEKELQCYRNALKIKPDLPEALMSLGIYLIRAKENTSQGLDMMRRAVKLVPDLFYRFQMAYFWFALASFDLGDEEAGQSHMQKGLNLSPGNVYLLNMKRDYLKKHWNESEEKEKDFISFLEYRLELDATDLDSFALLVNVHLTQKRIALALQMVKMNTGLLWSIEEVYIIKEDISISTYLSALPYYREYARFRQKHPHEQYDIADIDPNVISIMELISFGMFETAYRCCYENRNIKSLEKIFTETVITYGVTHFPICAPLMITQPIDNFETVKKEMATALMITTEVAMHEVGLVIGHLGHHFKLNLKKLNAAVSAQKKKKKNFGDIFIKSLEAIQNKHHILPFDNTSLTETNETSV